MGKKRAFHTDLTQALGAKRKLALLVDLTTFPQKLLTHACPSAPEILSVRTLAQSRIEHVRLRFSTGQERDFERIAGARLSIKAMNQAVLVVFLMDNGNLILKRWLPHRGLVACQRAFESHG